MGRRENPVDHSAPHRGRLAEHPTVDPVTAEVIRGAMETVCFEMATYVSRTATTPILNQSNERNATILDAKGRLAALSVGIPQFMLTSTLPVRVSLIHCGRFAGLEINCLRDELRGFVLKIDRSASRQLTHH